MEDLFDLTDLSHPDLFLSSSYPWEWLMHLEESLRALSEQYATEHFPGANFHPEGGPIHLEEGVKILAGAQIYGPVYIGAGAMIGHHAVVRGGCLVSAGCSVGHAVELKHAILLPGATCGHRNYIGDSILGRRVNMGDGSGTANLRADRDPKKTIKVFWKGAVMDTGLRKFGALVGDDSSIGCRATLQPGTVLGKGCLVYPNIAVGRTHPARVVLSPDYRIVSTPR